ncbi:16S rRNA (guanine(966)-N(2))-methyltransferase RsmD [Marinospirillum sp. MEB164]|uniref:Ribosomal RNA small subunit methyltransferase D n=1 Tax=Marinospirillum alkalitolerans TaxID=3123374 RepID=A0ABW8PTJ9_9GAMM
MMVKKKTGASSQIRIIAGEWRGRKLPVAEVKGLRPTPDRVRETLFNWLQFEVAGRRCLDAFAGTGALGAEALSRGAAGLVLLERDAKAVAHLRQHLLPLAGERAQLIAQDAVHWLATAPVTPFDLVFLDPPFAAGLHQPALDQLILRGWLAPGALVYLEQGARQSDVLLPTGWIEEKTRQAGEVRYSLWRQAAS